ncbi:hypothetical protein SBOR_4515 [Sclerotinia borealis F-4128]|uniref:Uncharacterized protein n=1 Tax=Sclerotinia borealis (strain F-4128) TaxID=1432307 RepID=W9CKB2_SCLBF|nr:hypothetical protein SBOR_4515 [Sclerotinia borealis F-4128]
MSNKQGIESAWRNPATCAENAQALSEHEYAMRQGIFPTWTLKMWQVSCTQRKYPAQRIAVIWYGYSSDNRIAVMQEQYD